MLISSHTAKIFREKAALEEALLLASSSHQTQRKSPRLATKSKQQVKVIPTAVVPEKSTSNTNITIKERSKRKRKLVLKEELCTPSRKQKKGERYACGKKRIPCREEGCTNIGFVEDTGQRQRKSGMNAATGDAPTLLFKEECVSDMVH